MTILTDRLRFNFTEASRDKGARYHHGERVEILLADDTLVEAVVAGTDEYYVCIELTRDRSGCKVGVSCSCPHFEDRGVNCKHIWAVLLSIDAARVWTIPSSPIAMEMLRDDDEAETVLVSDFVGSAAVNGGRTKEKANRKPPKWASFLSSLEVRTHRDSGDRQLVQAPIVPHYIIEPPTEHSSSYLPVTLVQQNVLKSGRLGKMKKLSLKASDVERIESPEDRRVCLMLVGASPPDIYGRYGPYAYYGMERHQSGASSFYVRSSVLPTLIPMMFETGRVYFRFHRELTPEPLEFEDGDPWEFGVGFSSAGRNGDYSLTPTLRRGDERRDWPSSAEVFLGDPALVVRPPSAFFVNTGGCSAWMESLRFGSTLKVRNGDLGAFARKLSELDCVPPIQWPEDWSFAEVRDLEPEPVLTLVYEEKGNTPRGFARASVSFDYDGVLVRPEAIGRALVDVDNRRQIHRAPDSERSHLLNLVEAGVTPDPYSRDFRVKTRRVPEVVRALLGHGWTVFGNDKKFTTHGAISVSVSSGIDWFELDGAVDFDGQSVSLPELLDAVRAGETFVPLGDASYGMLPEKWLAKFGGLLEMGQLGEDGVRFAKTQIGLIDALLAQMPDASFDKNLADARAKLREFDGIKPRKAPRGFKGTLREYQEQGLGWLKFLRALNWGGCLADDMGLGKTVEALALLRSLPRGKDRRCSLIVVPKSIVFNWIREAEHFTPALEVVDYTGTGRKGLRSAFDTADLAVTTYGTMKRDIEFLTDREFEYVILDEAQAIKNPNSQNAKAVRLLNARHRLVMTGTPVENRLEDLWSLFEFLNPGMLGRNGLFTKSFGKSGANGSDDGKFAVLRATLRPFILRRTKEQVAPDLPERSEQIIDCTMTKSQAKYYAELRDYYRGNLLDKVDRLGLAKAKIHVLEALLRLRQAACHPGLIDERKAVEQSAKLETLIPMIEELVSEGHKSLVFSQFTTMLGIVRARLDKLGIPYEYLDGKTRRRDQRVDRFQNDPKCPLFLISLKAGGTGLNLTAADYVFLMDPWWNPAVEAQAVDRTHRIGQNKSVMAYRLITRETVEAKVVALQQSKRGLADAIVNEDNSLIRNLTREDLDVLLS